MKVAPVSADLLIKLGLGVLLIGGAYLAVKSIGGNITDTINGLKKTVTGVFDGVTTAPAKVLDWATTEVHTRGEALQQANRPQSLELQDLTGRTYSNPLMTNDGMDFGQLSG